MNATSALFDVLPEVLCNTPGDDAVAAVTVAQQAPPPCPDDRVVVAVKATPVNPADVLLLTGRHVYWPTLPANVGIEGATVVVAMTPARRAAITAELLQLLHEGVFHTTVEARYPLADVRAALTHHARPGRTGKILLVS